MRCFPGVSEFLREAGMRLPTAAVVACDERPTRWESRRSIILRLGPGEAILVKDGELVHGRLPVMCCAAPIGSDIAQGQPDQLAGRLVGREVAARFDDLAQQRIHALEQLVV